MLVKVRTRGRPSPLDIRKVILVDKDSRVNESDGCGRSATPGEGQPSCCGMNKQPVLFLRAIATKKALLVNGDLKIMVTSESGTPNSEVAKRASDDKKFVSEHEFLLNHIRIPPCSDCSTSIKHENDSACSSGLDGEPIGAKRMKFEGQQFPDLSNSVLLNANQHGNVNPAVRSTFQNSVVELFTQKGAYLSTTCSCDENCQCNNCLIHREEAELEKYLNELNQPLVNLGSAHILTGADKSHPNQVTDFYPNSSENSSMNPLCLCEPEYCSCFNCEDHPEEIITLSDLLIHGILNYKWRQKMVIKYKNKLIHSKYWWQYLTVEIPSINEKGLRTINLIEWFDNLVSTYAVELPDAVDPVRYTNGHDHVDRTNNGNNNNNNNNNSNIGQNSDVNHSMNNSTENLIPDFDPRQSP
ncbi:unnamed protein product [Kluyveromyces dobzhanskii CBS 2104]|uniref:WGS project CCBQ000000000 data, contig 00017 n=1 Tax=Kluyveromyces dobzhanskii CBS 2104 TaxID=1427455 RepID=A0A0A8L8M2_9SACH|nr:unnamed protein product [Kluyveromyces dobzhanskii CBS 2104]